jgi:hypothetical protein
MIISEMFFYTWVKDVYRTLVWLLILKSTVEMDIEEPDYRWIGGWQIGTPIPPGKIRNN